MFGCCLDAYTIWTLPGRLETLLDVLCTTSRHLDALWTTSGRFLDDWKLSGRALGNVWTHSGRLDPR